MLSIFKAIRATGYELSIWVDAMGIIDLTALRQHIMRQRHSIWDGLDVCPRTCPSTLSRCCTYAKWFARPPSVHARSLLDIPVSAACMKGLLRFRMGCHRLPRDEGSWARPRVPRLERLCRLYATNTLDDEKHLVFECPELDCFREQCPIFSGAHAQCRHSCGRMIKLLLLLPSSSMRVCKRPVRFKHLISLVWLEEMYYDMI